MNLRRAFFFFLSLIVTTQVWAQISGGLTGRVRIRQALRLQALQ